MNLIFEYTENKVHNLEVRADPEEIVTMLLTWDTYDWKGITEVQLNEHVLTQDSYRGILLIVGIKLPDLRSAWEQADKTDYSQVILGGQ